MNNLLTMNCLHLGQGEDLVVTMAEAFSMGLGFSISFGPFLYCEVPAYMGSGCESPDYMGSKSLEVEGTGLSIQDLLLEQSLLSYNEVGFLSYENYFICLILVLLARWYFFRLLGDDSIQFIAWKLLPE